MYADWVELSDAAFHVACEQLGEAIRLPLKIGFRNRLRRMTMETQLGMPPAQSPPPPPQYVHHPSTAWTLHDPQPSTPAGGCYMTMGGAVAPYDPSYTPQHLNQQSPVDIRSSNAQPAPPAPSTEVIVDPASAGAEAKRPRLASPTSTVSKTVALEGSTGETLHHQLRGELSGTRVCGGSEPALSHTHEAFARSPPLSDECVYVHAAGRDEVSCVDYMEVEQKVATEEPPVARNVPCPLSEQDTQHGWNTLMNKCWLQCAHCNRWRNVPEEVRDKVRVALSCVLA